MYVPINSKAPLGLTSSETLWDKVSAKRLLEIIRNRNHKVLDCVRGTNSYGEFLFITVADNQNFVTFFGLGEHWHRDRIFIDEWHIGNYGTLGSRIGVHGPPKALSKETVLKKIRSETSAWKKYAKAHRQSAAGKRFETYADLYDDDSAYSNMDLF